MQLRQLMFAASVAASTLVFTTPIIAKPKPKNDTAKKEAKPAYTLEQVNRHITASLEWFVDHQASDGSWNPAAFSASSTRVRARKTYNLETVKPGEAEGDIGSSENGNIAPTALVLLCFSGNGNDHQDGPYSEYIMKGLKYLLALQNGDGCFGNPTGASFVHDHAAATMAVTELYALSGDDELKPKAQKALDFLISEQNDNSGWRYGVKPGSSDTQMTSWCVMAVHAGQVAGLEADYDACYAAAGKWYTGVTTEIDGTWKTGFVSPGDNGARMRTAQAWGHHPENDAMHIVFRLFSGDKDFDIKNKDLKKQLGRVTSDLPEWKDNNVEFTYWYFGSLAAFQYGDKEWKTWSAALLPALLEHQRGWANEDADTFESILDEFGSWDAVGAWHASLGRIGGTAMATLTLQVAARYMRLNK